MAFIAIERTKGLHFAIGCCQNAKKFHDLRCDAIECQYIFDCEYSKMFANVLCPELIAEIPYNNSVCRLRFQDAIQIIDVINWHE